MNVLFAVWENDPFFKLGGLGDVARSLPGALKTLGVDIRVIIPYYKVVKMGRNKKTISINSRFNLDCSPDCSIVTIYLCQKHQPAS